MLRFLGFVLLIAVLALAGFVIRTLMVFNAFDTLEPGFDGLCDPVVGLPGPEDLQIALDGSTVFISSYDRAAEGHGEDVEGGVYVFSLDNPLGGGNWRPRTVGAPDPFLPLGIHYFEGDGVKRLFAVNAATNAVEVFDLDEEGFLQHRETLSDAWLTSPNDVFAVGPDTFYVTNDAENGRESLKGLLDILLQRPTGKIMLYDRGAWSVAADGLTFANGIGVSAHGGRLYVTETMGQSVTLYDRDETGGLAFHRRIEVDTAVDNINLDAEGDLWIGAHPQPLALSKHADALEEPSPSEVLRVRFGAILSDDYVETVYLDDGREVSGSSVAARVGDHLLIGSVYEKKFLVCRMGADLPDF